MNIDDYRSLHRPSILIIDDNAPTLELYAGAFHQDYQVFTCSNSYEAAAIISSHSLQLVILEPIAAGSNPWGFLKEITQTYAIPVIVCSAVDDRKSGLEAGATAYLVKPVLPSTLREVLKSILN